MVQIIQENLQAVFGVIVGLCSIFLTPLLKNKKLRTYTELSAKIFQAIPGYITLAEKVNGYSGENKKDYVMQQIQTILDNKGVDLDIKTFDDYVEKLISMSKQVNIKPKSEGVTYK